MTPVDVIAWGAISAHGRGLEAVGVGAAGERAKSALRLDPNLLAGGRLRPLVGRARGSDLEEEASDRAESLLGVAGRQLARELDRVIPDFRSHRVRLVIGTSSGPMQSIEAALRAREAGQPLRKTAPFASYFSPLGRLTSELALEGVRPLQILAACASSTFAIGVGCRWLDADLCDLVIAGGYDALSALVAAGFDALGALTRTFPQPFRESRDGMALGEGAALVALIRSDRLGLPAHGRVLGFGASSDARHVTAPDPDGRGLAAAAQAALTDAGVDQASVELVSAHATATLHNDSAELQALIRVFGERSVPVHAWKGGAGHTLGAAGVLESLAAWDALARGIAPASVGDGPALPARVLQLLSVNRAQPLRVCLKLSAAFGGCNAALVLGASSTPGPGASRPRYDCGVRAVGAPVLKLDRDLLLRVAPGADRVAARADPLSELVLGAVAELASRLDRPLEADSALIVGTSSATLEANERFDARRRARRPVEPKRFPFTSPNACAGLASIAFGLVGPCLSLGTAGASARDALALGYDLVAAGDAPCALVVAAEESGGVVKDLFEAAGLPVPSTGAQAVLIERGAVPSLARDRLEAAANDLGLGPLLELVSRAGGAMAAVPRVGPLQ